MINITLAQIWQALEEVKDPEIPIVSVVEMGIVRDVKVSGEGVEVTMTPTFSGCPALDVMRQEIQARVREMGVEQVEVKTTYDPPWSSNWITPEAREKLRRFGLAPPPRYGNGGGQNVAAVAFFDAAACPRCGSTNTTLKNTFGPTLCRMIWYCHECQDAFEQFKPL